MPTLLRPVEPIDLVALAIARRFTAVEPPFALLPAQGKVLAASRSTTLDPMVLLDRARAR